MMRRLFSISGLFVLLVAPVQAQFWAPSFDFTLPAPKAGEDWQPGIDYIVTADEYIRGGYEPKGAIYWPVPVPPGKVVVTFFFQYTWDPALEKAVAAWVATQPNILFVRKPSVGWIHTRYFAQMFETLKALGRADELHFKFYDWVRQSTRYELYHGDPLRPDAAAIEQLNIAFATANGIDAAVFKRADHSPEVIYAANLVTSESHAFADGGNPADSTIAIDGKYMTSLTRVCHREAQAGTFNPEDISTCPDGFSRLFRLVSYLVADALERTKEKP